MFMSEKAEQLKERYITGKARADQIMRYYTDVHVITQEECEAILASEVLAGKEEPEKAEETEEQSL